MSRVELSRIEPESCPCYHAPRASAALELFGLKSPPSQDLVLFGAAIASCTAAGDWRRALVAWASESTVSHHAHKISCSKGNLHPIAGKRLEAGCTDDLLGNRCL